MANKRRISNFPHRKLHHKERRHVSGLDVVTEEKEVEFVTLPKLFLKSINRTQRCNRISSITSFSEDHKEEQTLDDDPQSSSGELSSSWGFFME